MTLFELHHKYYALYDDLKKAQDSANMSTEQYKAMAANIKRDYDQDVKDYQDEQLIAMGMKRFELKFKVRMYLPRRWLFFWWNPVAKKFLKQLKAEFMSYLATLEKNTREEIEYAKGLTNDAAVNSQQQSTALTVPSATDVAPK